LSEFYFSSSTLDQTSDTLLPDRRCACWASVVLEFTKAQRQNIMHSDYQP